MCEFRGVMVFPPTCRKVHEGCAAVVRWCANLVNSRMEQEEYKLGIPLCSQPVGLHLLAPLPPPDGHEPFSLARPQWPPAAGCAPQ